MFACIAEVFLQDCRPSRLRVNLPMSLKIYHYKEIQLSEELVKKKAEVSNYSPLRMCYCLMVVFTVLLNVSFCLLLADLFNAI